MGVVGRIKIFFWGWPKEFQRDIRDGKKQWKLGMWTCFLLPQIFVREDSVADKDSLKLDKVRRKVYVRVGDVNSLTHYFLVTNIGYKRMVYDRNSSGMNNSLWGPQFALPMVGSTLRAVEKGTFMSDRVIGYNFLNFMLSE